MTPAAPPSSVGEYSQERILPGTTGEVVPCARCAVAGRSTHLVFKADAIGRVRSRCPVCDRVAPTRSPHPDEVLRPQHLVSEKDLLPACPPGKLRCQRCARPVDGDERLCDDCTLPGLKKLRAKGTFQPKVCRWPDCGRTFTPTGSNARYCEVHA